MKTRFVSVSLHVRQVKEGSQAASETSRLHVFTALLLLTPSSSSSLVAAEAEERGDHAAGEAPGREGGVSRETGAGEPGPL